MARHQPMGDDRKLELERAFAALIDAGKAAHPNVVLSEETFARHLAHHRGSGPLADWLESIRAPDLYLACACANGDAAALATLDALLRADIAGYLAGMRASPAFIDDVAQDVRERVFVGEASSPPRIVEYAGRGAIGSWLRVVTVRIALDRRKRRTEELPGDVLEKDARAVAPATDPALAVFKRRHAGVLNRAFRAAILALPEDRRTLLRKHFAEGATLDDLAASLGVHRATIARWLAAARDEVLAAVKRELGRALGLRGRELESVIGLLRSEVDLNLSTAFPAG